MSDKLIERLACIDERTLRKGILSLKNHYQFVFVRTARLLLNRRTLPNISTSSNKKERPNQETNRLYFTESKQSLLHLVELCCLSCLTSFQLKLERDVYERREHEEERGRREEEEEEQRRKKRTEKREKYPKDASIGSVRKKPFRQLPLNWYQILLDFVAIGKTSRKKQKNSGDVIVDESSSTTPDDSTKCIIG